MTDIALSSGNIMRPIRSPWGSFPIRNIAVSTGVSTNIIRLGQLVGLDVNSTAFQNCVLPSSLSSACVVSTAIVGIAAESPGLNLSPPVGGTMTSTSPGGTPVIPVWEANPMVEFRVNSRKGLLNSTMVGQVKDLEWDSTLNIHLINAGASVLTVPMPRVVVTGLIDNVGDSGGAVSVRFLTHDPTLTSTAVGAGIMAPKILAFYS